jgi:hypothetical protein
MDFKPLDLNNPKDFQAAKRQVVQTQIEIALKQKDSPDDINSNLRQFIL